MMLTFENSAMVLTVRPSYGGRIDQIFDRKTDKQWLWHPGTYSAGAFSLESGKPRRLELGASFDDNWTGGWDEIFPNDAPGVFRGRKLVDHGELWSQVWDVIEMSPHGVKLSYECRTVPVHVEKTIRIDETRARAVITYVFRNISDEEVPFLFKMHTALAVEPGDEILLPECDIEPVDLSFSTLLGRREKMRFPIGVAADGSQVRLDVVPPASVQGREFYYCSDLTRGECGIRNPRTDSALIMSFDRHDFPYIWNFQSYGGWKDKYVVVLEPCTNIPWDLEAAMARGTAAILAPRETQLRAMTIDIA